MRPRLAPSVLLSPSAAGYDAFDTRTSRLHHLNPSAALIAELCDGSRTLDDLRDTLLPLTGNQGWIQCIAWIGQACGTELLRTDGDGVPPPDAATLADLARDLRDNDRVLEAFICQQHACELQPDLPDHWCHLGELAHIVGRRDTARSAYERYLASCPDDAEVAHIVRALRGEPPPERASSACIQQLYARFAASYDESMTGDLAYQAPSLLAAAVARVTNRTELAILDLGCGTGLSGEQLKPRARALVGVDLSVSMLDLARRREIYHGLHAAEMTEWLAHDTARYDLIVACDALIYFGDLTQVVAPAASRLAPGGLVAFTVEQGESFPFTLTDSGRFAHHERHVRDVAASAGLSAVSVEKAVLRYEYGEAVAGLVVVLQA